MSCNMLPMIGMLSASRSLIQPLLQVPQTVLTVISGWGMIILPALPRCILSGPKSLRW